MWFGTLNNMRQVDCRLIGSPVEINNWSESSTYLNGLGKVARSAGSHKTYEMNWSNSAGEMNPIMGYYNRAYGTGLLYFHDPMIAGTNMLSPQWAHPASSEYGDVPIVDKRSTTFTYSNTPANSLNLPARTVTIDYGFTTVKGNSAFVIPIPPDKSAHVAYRAVSNGVTIGYVTDTGVTGTLTLTPLVTGDWVWNTFDGDDYKWVAIYLTSGTTGDSIQLLAGMCQSTSLGGTPQAGQPWLPGDGYSGMDFDGSIGRTDVFYDASTGRNIMEISAGLREVGAAKPRNEVLN